MGFNSLFKGLIEQNVHEYNTIDNDNGLLEKRNESVADVEDRNKTALQ